MAIHRNITPKGGYHLKHKLKGLKKRKKQENRLVNGVENNDMQVKKNWEIPRKLLHTSIGRLSYLIFSTALTR
ncbi:6843_t:CDS:1, partial [Racocetra persica]